MKLTILRLFSVALLFSTNLNAQSTLQVSNLGQTFYGNSPIASDIWIAQRFDTGYGANNFSLTSIQLFMGAASGNPSGFTVSVYSSLNGVPAANLGVLSGSDPAAGGVFTYTTSGIMLAPVTDYDIILTSATPSSTGSYAWSAAHSFTDGNGGWDIEDVYFTSTNGLNWAGYGRGDVFQMALYTTATPEPPTWSLMGIGAIFLSLRWLKK